MKHDHLHEFLRRNFGVIVFTIFSYFLILSNGTDDPVEHQISSVSVIPATII